MDKTRFTIDWQGIRVGAARLADAARVLDQGRAYDRSQAELFGKLGKRIGKAQRLPDRPGASARSALDRDVSDGIRIVGDTVVLDDELMEHSGRTSSPSRIRSSTSGRAHMRSGFSGSSSNS